MYEDITIFHQKVGHLLPAGWYWHVGKDDVPHGPFGTRDEAEMDAIDPINLNEEFYEVEMEKRRWPVEA